MRHLVRALPRTACVRPGSSPLLSSASPSSLPRPPQSTRHLATTVDLTFGQPLHETHPHLLKAGERTVAPRAFLFALPFPSSLTAAPPSVTRGITAFEYAQRRANLARSLPDNSVAILAASDIKWRTGATFYKFHQDPSFFYLTGFNEPEAYAIIHKTGSGAQHNFWLFVRPRDTRDEKWEGFRSGIQAARDVFNADEAADVDSITAVLPSLIKDASHVFSDIPTRAAERSSFTKMVFGGKKSKVDRFGHMLAENASKPLRPYMIDLRVFKSEAEVANLRKAGQASGRAFTEAMRRQWNTECDLEGFIEYQFKRKGCETSGYVPVVAKGENALQIHYVRNDDVLHDGELLTVDAGGEYGGYVADITRAWPVNGKFSAAQKELYEMVLGVQRKCVSLCRQDANLSLDRLHGIAEAGLQEGLSQLGFDLGRHAMQDLFPHHVGHHVGLDIHDAPGYSRLRDLRRGQCITIEPGVYVANEERWPKHFRGMGIRVEDSICVQEESPLVLTTEAAKEVADIEALRR